MDKIKIVLIVLLLLLALMLIGLHFSGSPEGPHGGIVKRAGNYSVELKTSYPYFYTFLLDNDVKPMSNKGISCNTRFILADHTDIKVPLEPFEEDGFYTKLVTHEFISSQIHFNVHGETVIVKFENENLIVKKSDD